jgi:DNA-binding CsgD family transcriptional regulator
MGCRNRAGYGRGVLRGRDKQQAAIGALLERARAGVSGAVVLRGEPGIGKTALLDYAHSQAAGMVVLRAAGIESEAELPFAGLHLLVRPVLSQLATLPRPQERALSGAFGLAAGDPADRFLVGLGVLSLLSEAAPVLCLVDDSQWLDRASADALSFAARRLDRDGIVMIFAARDYPGAFTAPGIGDLPLGGLDATTAADLLADRDVMLPTDLRNQLIAETQGNPLAMIELSELVSTRRMAAFGPWPIPLTSRVLDAFEYQIRSLSAPASSALLLAAAAGTGDLGIMHRAGVDIADLRPAEERRLVSVTAGGLEFRHPLIRAAAYHGAAQSQRIAAHRSLAAACTGPGEADRRAWHLAVATTRPDEQVAAELESAGDRAAARSGYAAAAAAYRQAAQLSEEACAGARRLVLAAEATVDNGELATAKVLAERAGSMTTDPALTARLLRVRAQAEFAAGAMGNVHTLATACAELTAATDPELAVSMLMMATHAIWQAPLDLGVLAASVDRYDTLGLPPDHPLMPLVWLVRWDTAMVLGRSTEGFLPLEDVIAGAGTAVATANPRALTLLVGSLMLAGQDEAMAGIAAALASDCRARGVIGTLPDGLSLLAMAQILLGRHRDALINATEAHKLARDLGQLFWVQYTYGTLAYLAAIQGDEQQCRQYADEAARASDSVVGVLWVQVALALLELGYGRIQAAFDRLTALASGPMCHTTVIPRTAPDLVEAAVRLGRADQAAEALARCARWARLVGQPWIAALVVRCQALTAPDAEAERHYLRALKLHERDPRSFDQARTQLLYGEWLRRSKRKREARIHLRAAWQAFEELRARPWADRARTELTASGAAAPRPAAPDILAALTPQELQITRLAARGLPNRDIAAQLFLSPRTVAYHLYKAYPKLGVSSRSELSALIPAI